MKINNNGTIYRLNLMKDEYEALLEVIKLPIVKNNLLNLELIKKIDRVVLIDNTKKKISTKQASLSREKASRKKIQNAINLLTLEGSEITAKSISETSGVTFNTAKKYLSIINGE